MSPGDGPSKGVPRFDVQLDAPDLDPWRAGNTGVPGFTSFTSRNPGPHVAILALSHGNEIAGAIALERMLRDGLSPARGRLTFGFVNLAAFDRFDPRQPTLSRFVEEDINRAWDESLLNGPRRTVELDRAREIRPLIDTVDVLLDLHSMLWPSDPLILCGRTKSGRNLASAIGTPDLVVADDGHAGGRRLIDYSRFSEPGTPFAANLVEAGQHWRRSTVDAMLATVSALLLHLDMVSVQQCHLRPPPTQAHGIRMAEVTMTITATTNSFAFVQPWRGGEVVRRRNTLLALDGSAEIRTPHDDCLLVMPSLRPSRGHTAVRLARFV